jgi:hypothetical protein
MELEAKSTEEDAVAVIETPPGVGEQKHGTAEDSQISELLDSNDHKQNIA